MKYFYIEPELAGGFGEDSLLDTSVHPPQVKRLHYEFDGWSGDDLLTSFPSYILTDRLENKLDGIETRAVEIFRAKLGAPFRLESLSPTWSGSAIYRLTRLPPSHDRPTQIPVR